MVSKKKIAKLQKEFTKPQLSRWQREKKIQKIVYITGISIIIAMLVLVGTGYYLEEYRPLHAVIAEVNGEEIRMVDYLRTLRAVGKYNTSADTVNSAASYILKYYLESNIIMKQGAAKLGITVSKSEVNNKLKEQKLDKGYFPLVESQLLSDKLQNDYFKKQISTKAEQRNVQAMFLESKSVANEIINKLNQGENFTDLAALYSLDSYTKDNKGELGMHPKEIFPLLLNSSIPGDTAFILEAGQTSDPVEDASFTKQVGYWLIYLLGKGTGEDEGKINVRVMLLSSEEEALQIKTELSQITDSTQFEEKFAEIAKVRSQYKNAATDGGLIGMIDNTLMSEAFNNVAFSLQPGQLSDPVKDETQTTKGGYWVIRVTEIVPDKELSEDDINKLTSQKLQEWYGVESANATVTENLTSEAQSWAVTRTLKELGL